MFRLFALTASPGASAEACASLGAVSPAVARALLRELTEAALLEDDGGGVYSAHVLVRAFGDELSRAVESQADRDAAVTRLVQHYAHSSFSAASVLGPQPARIELTRPVAGVVPERTGVYAGPGAA